MVVFKNWFKHWDRITKNIILILNYQRPRDWKLRYMHIVDLYIYCKKSLFFSEYGTVAVQKRHSITAKLYTTAIVEENIRLQNMQIERWTPLSMQPV